MRCFCGVCGVRGVFVMCGGTVVFVVVCLCFRGGVRCFCDFVVVWCFCGECGVRGVFVMCGGTVVFVVVWLCFCGGAVRLCFCGGVVVFLRFWDGVTRCWSNWCSTFWCCNQKT